MNQPAASLDKAARQRDSLADRVTLPPWYLALSTAALVALFVAPALTKHGHRSVVVFAVTVPCVAILGLTGVVIRHHAGIRLSRDSTRYPSTRPVTIATLAAVAVGSVITWLVADWGRPGASLVFGVVSAAAVVALRHQTLAAIRRDIREGRAGQP